MGHHDEGESEIVPKIHQEVEHLGLHGHVERADGLVGVEDRGVDRQGTGGDPLQLAAGELVRKPRQRSRRRPDPLERGGKLAVAWSASLQCRTGSDSERRTVILGSSERRGFWNTIWFLRRSSIEWSPELPEVTVVEPNRARGDGAVRT